MSRLRAKIDGGVLKEHYQRGALRLLPIPVLPDLASDEVGSALGASPASETGGNHAPSENPVFSQKLPSNPVSSQSLENPQFFGFLSTLGGGMVNGDNYRQEFEVTASKASICSQSNQKIFKGTSALRTDISARASTLVFYNDANIFFENSNFSSLTNVHLDADSQLFLLDGGFCEYAKNNFRARLATRIFINGRLSFNDAFCYSQRADLSQFFEHSCFYQIIMKGGGEVKNLHSEQLISYASKVKDLQIIRVLSSDNDIAMSYISQLRRAFVALNDMTYVKINQF